MMHSKPEIVHLEACHVVGVSTATCLSDKSDPVRQAANAFHARKNEIPQRRDSAVILVQIYPSDGNFNQDTRYTAIVGARVAALGVIPEGMTGHTVPAGDYVRVTHTGPESDLWRTYDFLNGWIRRESGRYHAGHDFEVMDERYQGESATSQIDICVALS